jgi:hypothetical protein
MSKAKNMTRGDIEKSVAWLLKKKQKDVRAVLQKFRKLSPYKQKQLDAKLLYLVSILDHALKSARKTKAETAARKS